jgi:capsular exopolysaccharide synthesis family protein
MENRILDLTSDRPFSSRREVSSPGESSSAGLVASQSTSGEKLLYSAELLFEELNLQPASRLVVKTDPHGFASDRYRLLRMRLRDLKAKWKLKTVLITSPLPEDGKSTTVVNLATALAENGTKNVLVVEADLYHPSLVNLLGIKSTDGLAGVLERRLSPAAGIRRLEPVGWYLLPAGKPSGNPTELLHQENFAELMQVLAPHFDWILIDSPPVIPLADASIIKGSVSGTLLVTRAGHTPRKAIEKALTLLGNERILGVVLNATVGVNKIYSKYSKYYGDFARNSGEPS